MTGISGNIQMCVKDSELLNQLFSNSAAIILLLGKDGEIVGFNSYAENLTGYSSSEVLGKNWFELFIPKESSGEIGSVFNDIVLKKERHNGKINPIICKDGSLKKIEWRNSTLQESPYIYLGIGIDITEKSELYQKIKKSNATYESLISTLPAIIYSFSVGHGGVYFNKEAQKFFGKTSKELLLDPMHWYRCIHPDDIEAVDSAIDDFMKNKKHFDIEYRLQNSSGEYRWMRDISYNRDEVDGKIIIAGLAIDMTVSKDVELELQSRVEALVKEKIDQEIAFIEQSKMAAMSELMTNIAHHWRQPLAALSLQLDIVKDYISENEGSKEETLHILDDASSTFQRLSHLINAFQGRVEDESKNKVTKFKLAFEIDDAILFFKKNHAEEIGRVEFVQKSEGFVYGKSGSISSVILTLLHNSLDAMRSLPKEDRVIKVEVDCSGDEAFIKVSDRGCGIPKDSLKRIYEPYFTTKFRSVGTGMGLYVAKMIVESEFKGKISAKNLDMGACFEVILPIVDS